LKFLRLKSRTAGVCSEVLLNIYAIRVVEDFDSHCVVHVDTGAPLRIEITFEDLCLSIEKAKADPGITILKVEVINGY